MINTIADSGCDLTPLLIENKISHIPLSIDIGDKHYIDTLSLNKEEFWAVLKENPKKRSTSAPSPQSYFQAFSMEDECFAVTLSSKASNSYANAEAARMQCLNEFPQKKIYVIDSKSASAGETLIAERIIRYSQQGMDFEQIKSRITVDIEEMTTFFVLEHYDSLADRGKINPYIAKIADKIGIVPICCIEDGTANLMTQVRGEEKVYDKLTELILKTKKNFERLTLYISHVNNPKKAEILKDTVSKRINFGDVKITAASGLCSLYADTNGMVIAF